MFEMLAKLSDITMVVGAAVLMIVAGLFHMFVSVIRVSQRLIKNLQARRYNKWRTSVGYDCARDVRYLNWRDHGRTDFLPSEMEQTEYFNHLTGFGR